MYKSGAIIVVLESWVIRQISQIQIHTRRTHRHNSLGIDINFDGSCSEWYALPYEFLEGNYPVLHLRQNNIP